MKGFKILFIGCLLCLLVSCTWWNKEEDKSPFEGVPAKQLFDESKEYISKGEYSQAIKRLEAMDTLYPFNDYAEQAQLDLIYAYYKKGDYPSTAATAERFIHLYPRAERVDYAYYMKGLANFQQNRGTLAGLLPLDESWRDPGTQSQAYTDFATLIQQFPNSRYKANALQRMIYLRNLFAQRELNVSKYYYQRKMYVAAAERASFLVRNYPQAAGAQEALAIMFNANLNLGLVQAAEDARRVYQSTYHAEPPRM
ncbi:competence lipoprotein ComL (plasmid) [Legionella adelaidensis]|uniref:Outer membrane protein assembly factor BamD n=1 Tax=Legionella adelaidensis TaxID=45056 RepID=A0A0W0R422_9GAMM|nr:outer membrane protein assembly factor BamD [Legionella adelaidensis]KTC65805.1 competence lipoprotein ComL [Legionella adelaidensis]VEH85233.1 competence lipoprotein ComL [Legionella adelaidensis]